MKLKQVLSRGVSADDLRTRKHVPFIVDPIDRSAQQSPGENSESKVNLHDRSLQSHEPHRPSTDSGSPVFKHHKESSTVELFYDLFFVANLSSFTNNHEIRDLPSLKNYIGFFALLWFTWLETSLFDVRFSSDSVFMRICKAVSFGVMTGFAVCGSIYDTTDIGTNSKAFRAMALILMISRLALVAQYGVILWYVRAYKQTLLPLGLTMLSLFITAMVFLGTFFGFPKGSQEEDFPIESGGGQIYVAWYVIVCAEAAALIGLSCIWRVISFKHTHLVERIGLLTLIIMGEGIIGMTKSVSTILQNSSSVSSSDIGVVVAAVLLIYFVWVLYFDQIEHDRFGTIRQQIWAILHFPLHVSLLLVVEGSTTLIIWNIISQDIDYLFGYLYPGDTYDEWSNYSGIVNKAGLVEWLNYSVESFAARFKEGVIKDGYDWTANITYIQDMTTKFGTQAFIDDAGYVVDLIFDNLQEQIFKNFDIELPERTFSKGSGDDDVVAVNNIDALYQVFSTVFAYFYISAGIFLMILAIMYYFGKTHKSKGEYFSIVVRVIFGILVILPVMTVWIYTDAADNFYNDAWHIPIVVLVYFIVIVLDNLLVWHTNKTISRQTSSKDDEYSLRDTLSKRGHSRVKEERGSNEEMMRTVSEEEEF